MHNAIVVEFGDQKPSIGSLDAADNGTIRGWLHQPERAPVLLKVSIDETIVFSGEVKPELRTTAPDQRIPFAIPIPPAFANGELHRIAARTGGADWGLDNSPLVARLSAISEMNWQLERTRIVGSVLASVERQLEFDIVSGTQILDTFVVQGLPRSTVQFNHWLPWRVFDGASHDLRLSLRSERHTQLPTTTGAGSVRFSHGIRSVVDSVTDDIVSGWAYDVRRPGDKLEIALHDGDVEICRVYTDELRADVNDRFSITGSHGFKLEIPSRLFDGEEHDFRLVSLGSTLESPYDAKIPNVLPKREQVERRNEGHSDRVDGRIERIDCVRIDGWAANLDFPERIVSLAVVIDGRIELVTDANRYQKRFESIGGHGHHGYSVDLPTRLMNGKLRRVEVKILDRELGLSRTPGGETGFDVFFPLIIPDAAGVSDPARRDRSATAVRIPVGLDPVRRPTAIGSTSIIVLNWNGTHLLGQLFESLTRFIPDDTEVVLVDHGSSDGSLSIAEQFREKLRLKILARGKNYSFSESNNFAAREATGDYLLFLNNDIVLTQDCVEPLATRLAADPSIGMLGIRLVEPIPQEGGTRFSSHHCGIKFEARLRKDNGGQPIYYPVEHVDDVGDLGLCLPAVAVTAAASMCRKADFLAIGGFEESYFYGLEDVDLSFRLAEQLGKRIACDTSIVAIHNRSATRSSRYGLKSNPVAENADSQLDNGRTYLQRFGPRIKRSVFASLVEGEDIWRREKLRVAIAVTDAQPRTKAGDLFTALEFGLALRSEFGWEVLFVKNTVTDVPGVDVVVAMRHDFDVGRLKGANPGLLAVAWIRNRLDEWLATPGFDAYSLICCASETGCEAIALATGRHPVLLPIATNEDRFSPEELEGETIADSDQIVFSGNYWGVDRKAVDQIDLRRFGKFLGIYGAGWEGHPRWSAYWRGALPYRDLPQVYRSAKIVIDDSHAVTRNWDFLNSRVFDALAAGALVITNCRGGAKEQFQTELPSFSTSRELNALLGKYLHDEEARADLVTRLRGEVLEKHTYKLRAAVFKRQLLNVARSIRIAIKIGVPNHDVKATWGDWHFALALKRSLERAGAIVRIDLLPEWERGVTAGDDVAIVLRGLSRFKPRLGTLNLLWLISHPDDVTEDELKEYDHVFVASYSHARVLEKWFPNVSVLLQCTDPSVFHPAEQELRGLRTALFVGNSRKKRRPIVEDAIAGEVDLAVFGGDWDGLIDPRYVLGRLIPNDQLHAYYSSATVVLNDHWPDMRQQGYISNRLFDAGACGAAIVTDEVDGLQETFGGIIKTYRSVSELKKIIQELKINPEQRKVEGLRLRKIILDSHTFEHRAKDILELVRKRLGRPIRIS